MTLWFPSQKYPRSFFIDLNAFYTSVEQQECEKYRGQPTIVVPVLAETTCAIAASYEAKALGIKTGTSVQLARIACPSVNIVEARPELYLQYHSRLLDVLNTHFASIKVLSIDEMACRVPPLYKTTPEEEKLAKQVKAQVGKELGSIMRCSVGIGPNVFLAKVAAEKQKPDGLTIFHDDNLPDALFEVKLGNLPGIGSAIKRRLEAQGITTVQALWDASPRELRQAWGSVVGERYYYMLRGDQQVDYQPMQAGAVRKSVGHSNVLAPQHRSLEAAKKVLLELFGKALKRLRAYSQAASAVQITVRYRKLRGQSGTHLPYTSSEGVWTRRSRKHLHANDEATWLRVIRPLMEAMPDLSPTAEPCYVGIVFSELLACQDLNLSLFDETQEPMRLASIVDEINRKHKQAVSLASMQGLGDQVPLRIPFGAPDHRAL